MPYVKAPKLGSLSNIYRDMIEPIDLGDLFELLNRNGDSRADAEFERMVQAHLRQQPSVLSPSAYLKACDDIRKALPPDLRTLNVKVSDQDGLEQSARADVAFRLGIEVGRILSGGAR